MDQVKILFSGFKSGNSCQRTESKNCPYSNGCYELLDGQIHLDTEPLLLGHIQTQFAPFIFATLKRYDWLSVIGLPLNFSSPIPKPESRQLCLTFHKGAYLNGNTEEDNCDSNPEFDDNSFSLPASIAFERYLFECLRRANTKLVGPTKSTKANKTL